MSLVTDCLALAIINLAPDEQAALILGVFSYLRENEMEQVLHQRNLEGRIVGALSTDKEARCPCCDAQLAGILQTTLLSARDSRNKSC